MAIFSARSCSVHLAKWMDLHLHGDPSSDLLIELSSVGPGRQDIERCGGGRRKIRKNKIKSVIAGNLNRKVLGYILFVIRTKCITHSRLSPSPSNHQTVRPFCMSCRSFDGGGRSFVPCCSFGSLPPLPLTNGNSIVVFSHTIAVIYMNGG